MNPRQVLRGQQIRQGITATVLPKLQIGEPLPITPTQLARALRISKAKAGRHLKRALVENGVELRSRKVLEINLIPQSVPGKKLKLSWETACEIRTRYKPGLSPSMYALAAEYNVDRTTIRDVVHGRTWREE